MSRFIIPEAVPAGVVEQTAAGLMWSAADISEKPLTHEQAVEACAKLDLAGFTDWRLPTVEELFPLADRSRFRPAIDTDFFPTCKSDWYWTSSPAASAPDCAWLVRFYGGHACLLNRYNRCAVRAVRSLSRASQ